MINFINQRNEEIVKLSYTKVAQEFLVSPENKEKRGFVVNMMIFFDYMEEKEGLKFVKLNSVDWEELWQATTRVKLGSNLKLAV